MAPTYISAVALLLTELAKIGGFTGTLDGVGAAILTVIQLVAAIIIAARQILGVRSTLFGARPRSFRSR